MQDKIKLTLEIDTKEIAAQIAKYAKDTESLQKIDFAYDAENWGSALNEATWEFTAAYREIMDEVESTRLFNHSKMILRRAILEYVKCVKEKNA